MSIPFSPSKLVKPKQRPKMQNEEKTDKEDLFSPRSLDMTQEDTKELNTLLSDVLDEDKVDLEDEEIQNILQSIDNEENTNNTSHSPKNSGDSDLFNELDDLLSSAQGIIAQVDNDISCSENEPCTVLADENDESEGIPENSSPEQSTAITDILTDNKDATNSSGIMKEKASVSNNNRIRSSTTRRPIVRPSRPPPAARLKETPPLSRGMSEAALTPKISHLSKFVSLQGKDRSNSLPGDQDPTEQTKDLNRILNDESLLFAFTEHMTPSQKDAVDFWSDTKRFLEYAGCTDPLVANNMAQNICKTYKSKESIPSSLRSVLAEHLEGKFGDLETNITFIRNCQNEILAYILYQLYPSFRENANNGPAPTPRQAQRCPSYMDGDILEDPFEDFTEDSVRTMNTEKGEMIVAASVERIINLLTGDLCDHELTFTIILTMKYFLEDEGDLLDLLKQRFYIFIRKHSNKKDPKVIKILLRIVNVIKIWIEAHLDDFVGNNSLPEQVRSFAKKEIEPILPSAATNLINFLDCKAAAVVLSQPEEFQFSEKPPKIKKGSMKGIKKVSDLRVDDIHPKEFARQLALVDHDLYRAIQPNEVLHMNWTKDATKHKKAPNVLRMIEQFNRVGQWVISTVITTYDKSRRAKLLHHMIRIAYESYRLNNLNGAMAMISGLRNSNVIRLKDTWNDLPSSAWDMWEEITNKFVLNDNFASLRAQLKEIQPPLIPYLGIYLSDLTFTEGQPSFIQSDCNHNLVNLSKMRSLAQVQQAMKEGQSTPYCLTRVPLIQEYITSLHYIPENEYLKHRQACEDKVGVNSPSRASRGSIQLDSSNLESRKPKRTKSFFTSFSKLGSSG